MAKKVVSFTELKQLIQSNFSSVIYFGAGDSLIKTRKRISVVGLKEYLGDNNPNLQNTQTPETDNLLCLSAEDLPVSDNKKIAIITCSSYNEVGAQLVEKGYEWGKNLFLTPYYQELKESNSEIYRLNSFLIASGYPSEKNGGGGLYFIEAKSSNTDVKRLKTGQIQCVKRINDEQILTTSHLGLELHQFYKGESKIYSSKHLFSPSESGSRLHGIAYDQNNKTTAIAASHNDTIYLLDENYKLKKTIHISNASTSQSSTAMHHINDIFLEGKYIFYTCFSKSGSWKYGCYDGCLVKLDIETGYSDTLIDNLYMPHNVDHDGDTLWVCDSMRSEALSTDHQKFGKFSGFLRGLDTSISGLMVLGLSTNRNRTRALSANSISYVNSGIVILDKLRSVARLITLPYSIPGIHSIQNI